MSLKVTAWAQKLGPTEARVSLKLATQRGSRCSGTVRAGGRLARLPTLTTTARHAGWRWVTPRDAPRGTWRFRVSCVRAGRHATRSARVRVRVPATKSRSTGLIFPGSLAVAGGHYKHSPRSQADGISRGSADGNPGEAGYCTWGAWNQAPWLGTAVVGNANQWYASGTRNGLPGGETPIVGAVFVSTAGKFGHVGVVTGIVDATTFTTMEMNGGNRMIDWYNAKTNEFGQFAAHTQSTGPNMHFLYKPGTQPGAWIGQIVQWDGDTKAQKTAWLVGPDGKRRWIPTIAIFGCLKNHGVAGPTALPPVVLDQYPDLKGTWVTCGPGGFGAGSGPAPTDGAPPPPPPLPAPPPPPAFFTHHVDGTCRDGACGLRVRTGPGYSNYQFTHVIYDGDRVEVVCQAMGETVSNGHASSAVWDRQTDGTWVSDFYIDTPNIGTWSPPIPQC